MKFSKKLSKHDAYFLEMIDREAKYIAETGGEDGAEPFITPVLFALSDSLRLACTLLGIQLGLTLALIIDHALFCGS